MTPNQTSMAAASLTAGSRLLLVVLFLNGIGGVGGGIGVMKDALPFPQLWLDGTPFRSYFLPGLILCVVVGGTQLFAAYALLARRSFEKGAAAVAGCILIGWMIGEIYFIGYRAPIQAWFLALGVLELILSLMKLRRVA
jgi:hypothetical protein